MPFGIATGAYEDVRDDWAAAVERAIAEGRTTIELTAITEVLWDTLRVYLTGPCDELSTFERVSVHAPVIVDSTPAAVAHAVFESPWQYDVVFHPDLFRVEDVLGALGERAVFENMDANKGFGRTVDDLARTFRRFPRARFCLDVAHVWTNDPTLGLGFELLHAFSDRLAQLHISGIEPDGTHRPMTEADLALYEPLLADCAGVPWLLESELA